MNVISFMPAGTQTAVAPTSAPEDQPEKEALDPAEVARLLEAHVSALRNALQSMSLVAGARAENLAVARYLDRQLMRAGAVRPAKVLQEVT